MQKPKHKKIKFLNKSGASTVDFKWVGKMATLTFFMSILFNIISGWAMSVSGILVDFLILMMIILVGIIFDIIGVSVTTASLPPLCSMASRKIPGALEAIRLIAIREKVSNFCNDVIGDTCGIISGSACSALVLQFIASRANLSNFEFSLNLILTAIVAALTVSGRSIGKSVAIFRANAITFGVGKILYKIKIKKIQRFNLPGFETKKECQIHKKK
jgi:hypothetical protein